MSTSLIHIIEYKDTTDNKWHMLRWFSQDKYCKDEHDQCIETCAGDTLYEQSEYVDCGGSLKYFLGNPFGELSTKYNSRGLPSDISKEAKKLMDVNGDEKHHYTYLTLQDLTDLCNLFNKQLDNCVRKYANAYTNNIISKKLQSIMDGLNQIHDTEIFKLSETDGENKVDVFDEDYIGSWFDEEWEEIMCYLSAVEGESTWVYRLVESVKGYLDENNVRVLYAMI